MAINKSKLVAIIVKTTTFKSLYANLKDKGKDKGRRHPHHRGHINREVRAQHSRSSLHLRTRLRSNEPRENSTSRQEGQVTREDR